MEWKNLIIAAIVAGSLCFAGLGCDQGDQGNEEGNGASDTAEDATKDTDGRSDDTVSSGIALEGIQAFSGVQGTVQVEAKVKDTIDIAKLELLINDDLAMEQTDESFVFDWDTTKSVDGPVDLSVRATLVDGSKISSEIVRVVIINDGIEVVDFEEGTTATMSIPADYDGTQETHVKHHFTPAENYTRALCVAIWENPIGGAPWNMKAEMGTGTCPHSGAPFEGFGISDTGAVEFDVLPTQGVVKGERHFCHVGAENAFDHVGQQIDVTYKVFLFGFRKDMTDCPLNSAFPCRCDGVLKCEDGSDCVGYRPDQNGGACAKACNGEDDSESCADTHGFGLFGFCGASKTEGPATHCLVVCSDEGQTGSCPPDLNCDPASGVCLPIY